MQEYHFKNSDFYYSSPEEINGDELILKDDEFIHLTKVMRKKNGDMIRTVDGLGYIYECKINNINKNFLSAEILNKVLSDNEPDMNITLALGLLKNPSKFDFVVEKATELGVKKIIPFISKHTISQKPKIDRWQNLAISAMKQSQRAFLPIVSECYKFDDLLNIPAELRLIAEIDSGELNLIRNTTSCPEILILIGPEGGFSDDEIDQAVNAGFRKIKLSSMRLRAETAAIACIPLLLEKFKLFRE